MDKDRRERLLKQFEAAVEAIDAAAEMPKGLEDAVVQATRSLSRAMMEEAVLARAAHLVHPPGSCPECGGTSLHVVNQPTEDGEGGEKK